MMKKKRRMAHGILAIIKKDFDEIIYDKTFSILSNPDNKVYMDELVKYGKQNADHKY